ncbi:MAG: hypothetical protein H6Q39_725, partial [Chloroflexi bacterium]|nr:hypothetical protein [Chloroflexota bacterium]
RIQERVNEEWTKLKDLSRLETRLPEAADFDIS